eukprot:TRINITY_DN7144_c0_g1_i1.p2 TRINITY_DN7144_c0_g1~~TRINITY_DN7144_c0_g1_i1.p2  ORF type:complete len:277 (+),score=61.75 TRINITY_DN7144_c0_g1_i1:2487-3317(+)
MEGLQQLSKETTEAEQKALRAMEQGEQIGEMALFSRAALANARYIRNNAHVDSLVREQPSPEPERSISEEDSTVKPLLDWAEELKQRSDAEEKALRLVHKRQKEAWQQSGSRFAQLLRDAKACSSLEALDAFVSQHSEIAQAVKDVNGEPAGKRSRDMILVPRPDLEEVLRKQLEAKAASPKTATKSSTETEPETSMGDGLVTAAATPSQGEGQRSGRDIGDKATASSAPGDDGTGEGEDGVTRKEPADEEASKTAREKEEDSVPPVGEQKVFICL